MNKELLSSLNDLVIKVDDSRLVTLLEAFNILIMCWQIEKYSFVFYLCASTLQSEVPPEFCSSGRLTVLSSS